MSDLTIIARQSAGFAEETFKRLDQKLQEMHHKADWEYVFVMNGFYFKGPAFVAIAELSETDDKPDDNSVYFMMAPDYMEERQEKVFEYFLKTLMSGNIVVFNQKDYERVQRFNVRNINVKQF